MGLQGIERRLEQLVEGSFARVFRTHVRPVELGRRLVREMDIGSTVGVNGERVAPNAFVFHVAPDDYARLIPFGEPLIKDLADMVETYAADEKLSLRGPAMIEIQAKEKLRTGRFSVEYEIRPGHRETPPAAWLILPSGTTVALRHGDPVVIGRSNECDLTLSDPNASREHAEIRLFNHRATVLDLGSLNGTKVNGRGVPADALGLPLVDGDRIQISNTVIVFTTNEPTKR
jgi:Protein of unknown function (DUF3662)/FHA domain